MTAWDLQKHLADMEDRITAQIVQVGVSVQTINKDLTDHKVEDAKDISAIKDRVKWISRGVMIAFGALATAFAAHVFTGKP